MFSSWRRSIAIALFAVLIVAGIVFTLWPRPVPADFATLARGPLEVTIGEEGVTAIRDVFVVSAPVSGRSLRSPREVGDRVSGGETLVAVIQPTPPAFLDERGRREAEARVRAAEAAEMLGMAEVRRASAERNFAITDLERAEKLAERGTISERALDEARLQVDVGAAAHAKALADLAVRRQELTSAKAHLIEPRAEGGGGSGADCCVNIRAPTDGEVLKIMHESEQIITAGTPLVEIGDPASLEVTVDLLSADAVQIRPGAIAYIDRWGGAERLQAKVRKIDPAGFTKVSALGIEEQRVTVTLDPVGDEDAWEKLGHDFRIYAHIVVWQSDDVLRIPLSALFRHGQNWAAFQVVDGRARRVGVEIGQRSDRFAELTSGLEAGDRVVIHPGDLIDDGVPVAARDAP
ncbi:MAG: HlyD family efflux transporter periplasmic adaptor subunit [Rhizobiales bacterium]|nr:HlyD family efflux transporter periplasmic adaptor subunit [Hyphomicrobiales bacterium]